MCVEGGGEKRLGCRMSGGVVVVRGGLCKMGFSKYIANGIVG